MTTSVLVSPEYSLLSSTSLGVRWPSPAGNGTAHVAECSNPVKTLEFTESITRSLDKRRWNELLLQWEEIRWKPREGALSWRAREELILVPVNASIPFCKEKKKCVQSNQIKINSLSWSQFRVLEREKKKIRDFNRIKGKKRGEKKQESLHHAGPHPWPEFMAVLLELFTHPMAESWWPLVIVGGGGCPRGAGGQGELRARSESWVLHCRLGAGIVHASFLSLTLGKKFQWVKMKPVPAGDQDRKPLNAWKYVEIHSSC